MRYWPPNIEKSRTPASPNGPETDKTGLFGLAGIFSANGSSKTVLVELRGLEPLTPTLPVWCATSCAIAP